MSTMKNLLFQMLEADHELAIKRKEKELFGDFSEEEKQELALDHVAGDVQSQEREEVEE